MSGEAPVTVFADTNLGTRIAFNASPNITSASLKSKSTALKKQKILFFSTTLQVLGLNILPIWRFCYWAVVFHLQVATFSAIYRFVWYELLLQWWLWGGGSVLWVVYFFGMFYDGNAGLLQGFRYFLFFYLVTFHLLLENLPFCLNLKHVRVSIVEFVEIKLVSISIMAYR